MLCAFTSPVQLLLVWILRPDSTPATDEGLSPLVSDVGASTLLLPGPAMSLRPLSISSTFSQSRSSRVCESSTMRMVYKISKHSTSFGSRNATRMSISDPVTLVILVLMTYLSPCASSLWNVDWILAAKRLRR